MGTAAYEPKHVGLVNARAEYTDPRGVSRNPNRKCSTGLLVPKEIFEPGAQFTVNLSSEDYSALVARIHSEISSATAAGQNQALEFLTPQIKQLVPIADALCEEHN